ncbi:ATP-binding protein [Chloroflexota bacterium]
MKDKDKTKKQLINELEETRQRVAVLGALQFERKQAEEELRKSEERYRDLFENANDLIQSVTPAGHFLYVNKAWREKLGYSEEEVATLTIWDVIHPDSLPHCRKVFQEVASGGTVENVEAVFVAKGGNLITVEGNANSRFMEGKALATRGIFRDITQRRQTEKKIEELHGREKELRQALENEIVRRDEFNRAVVHELKTPLVPMLAASELLTDKINEEQRLALVRSIQRSASTISSRIDRLLDVTRGELGMLALSKDDVDLVKLLNQVVEDLSPLASNRGLSFVLDVPSSLTPVWADSGRLEQVLQNFLSNAFKFTPQGGKVTLRANEKDGALVVEVQDTGLGIAKENWENVFEAYYRLESGKQHSTGLGLGLALCKIIVEAHGGKVWAESEEGGGSTFSFSIPLSRS